MIVFTAVFLFCTYGPAIVNASSAHVPDFFKVKAAAALASSEGVIVQAVELEVKIAVGGDTHHADTPDELRGLVKGGMTPLDTMAVATVPTELSPTKQPWKVRAFGSL